MEIPITGFLIISVTLSEIWSYGFENTRIFSPLFFFGSNWLKLETNKLNELKKMNKKDFENCNNFKDETIIDHLKFCNVSNCFEDWEILKPILEY